MTTRTTEQLKRRINEIRNSQRVLEPDASNPRVARDLRDLDLQLAELLDQPGTTAPQEPETNWSPLAAQMQADLDRMRQQL